MSNSALDLHFMRLAIAEAHKCAPVETAYNVGCVLVSTPARFASGSTTNSLATPADCRILATGFSRELPGNTHAEECALIKLVEQLNQQNQTPQAQQSPTSDQTTASSRSPYDLATQLTDCQLTIYTTMEPCSQRLSGNRPCVDRIKQFNEEQKTSHSPLRISRCVVGALEPQKFIAHCQGIVLLKEAQIQVDVMSGLEADCLSMNAHVLN